MEESPCAGRFDAPGWDRTSDTRFGKRPDVLRAAASAFDAAFDVRMAIGALVMVATAAATGCSCVSGARADPGLGWWTAGESSP